MESSGQSKYSGLQRQDGESPSGTKKEKHIHTAETDIRDKSTPGRCRGENKQERPRETPPAHPTMGDRSKRGPITYSGCWTCKARKVKCDEKPGGCRACARIGVTCGGYEIKLHWVYSEADEKARRGKVERTGRRRISSGPESTLHFDHEDIDHFLSEIENASAIRLSSVCGPFAIFTATCYDSEQASTTSEGPEPEPDSDESTALESDEETLDQNNDVAIAQSPHRQQLDALDSLSSVVQNNSHNAALDLIGESAQERIQVSENANIDTEQCQDHHLNCTSFTSSPWPVPFLCRQPQQHMSEYPEADALLRHYSVNISDILQPVFHPDNPYRSIYVPAAVEGLLGSESTIEVAVPNVKRCIFHSLIATAAFHLTGCNSAPKYHNIGIRHRQMALQCMQLALNGGRFQVNYRHFMIALFSLITIGVMEGTIIDFRTHIGAMLQLQQSRASWTILGPETVRLNQMSMFLGLLANTTSCHPLPEHRPQLRDAQRYSTNSQVYFCEFTYGVTMDIAYAIEEMMELYGKITYYHNAQRTIPPDLAEACEMLGDRLLSWSLSPGKAAAIFPGQLAMQRVFDHHARAWCLGATIHYLQRIQGNSSEDVVEQVAQVANHLHLVEDIKANNPRSQMAPITWPAFIASCSALDRDPWVAWWTRIQWYKIGSVKRQFEIVQEVWDGLDANPGMRWLDILRSRQIEVLAL